MSFPSSFTLLRKSSAFPPLPLLLLLLPQMQALLPLRRRPSSTSSLLRLALRRSRSSRLSVSLPVSALLRLRLLLTALPRLSRKAFPRKTLRLLRQSLKKSAQRSSLSNSALTQSCDPVQTGSHFAFKCRFYAGVPLKIRTCLRLILYEGVRVVSGNSPSP